MSRRVTKKAETVYRQIIKESPDTYRTTFEVTGTAMVVIDDDTTIILANQEMARLTGYPLEELEGKIKITSFIHPRDLDRMLGYHHLRRSRDGEAPNHYTFTLVDRYGKEKEILINIRLIPATTKSVASLIDVSEYRALEARLRESEEKFRALFENAQEGIYQSTPEGRILLANTALVRLLGYSSLEELLTVDMKDIYVDEKSRQGILKLVGDADTFQDVELHWKKKDGTPIIVRANGRAKKDETGRIIFYETMVVNVTESKQREDELQASRELFKNIINCLPDPTYAIDIHGKVIAWNMAMEAITGVPYSDIIGKGDYEYALPFYGDRRPVLVDFVINPQLTIPERYQNVRRTQDSLAAEAFVPLLRQGKGAYIWGSATLLRDSSGEIIGAISTIKDFTEYKETQKQLEYLGMHDTLTGLYNRSYFDEEISRLNNPRWTPISIIICDVDNLKLVNDTLGHHQGDKLLKAASAVIRSPFRSSDVIARIGGDEIAVLLPKTDARAAEEATERIRLAVEHYNLSTPDFPLSLSIGHATGDLPILNTFIAADNQMYREKLKRSAEVKKNFISRLMSVLSSRKYFNEEHINRLRVLARLMAKQLQMSRKETADLLLLAKYRDLGMVAVPENILLKPGKLTGAEFEEIKKHCEIGFRIAQTSQELNHIARYILYHQEWWNGEGYPSRLKGEEIPLLSRIQAILDAFEALTSERPHRTALTCDEALMEIKNAAGTRFQPELVETFISIFENEKTRSFFGQEG